MNQELLAVVVDIGRMFMKSIPISLALAAVFTVLTQFWACNPGRPWWRKRDLVTDLCYWFFIPVVTRYFRIGLLIAGAAVFFHITTADGLIAFYENGHGPLAALPLVVQMLIFLVGEDVITYWTHRLFPTAGGCGSTTPCIIPPKSWNGFQPRVSIRSICSSAR
jgi:sterol desaturase/sphingolipid hydroxylase (fatty acid hydroxylase superfamily)